MWYINRSNLSVLGTDVGIYFIVFIYSNNPFIANILNSWQNLP